jgi:hypothetical protein
MRPRTTTPGNDAIAAALRAAWAFGPGIVIADMFGLARKIRQLASIEAAVQLG